MHPLSAQRRRLATVLLGILGVLLTQSDVGAGAAPGDVDVVAGQPRADCLDVQVPPAQPGSATGASFDYRLTGIAVDALGRQLFLAESRHKIVSGVAANDARLWKVALGSNHLESAAGGGSDPGDTAAANADILPVAVAIAPNQPNRLYFMEERLVGERLTLLLRTLENGSVQTVQNLGAAPGNEVGLAADAKGNLYYSDTNGINRISGGSATKLPNGAVTRPTAVAVDAAGTTLYAVDMYHGTLVAVDLASAQARTLRSDLVNPTGVAVDLLGTRLFVAQQGSSTTSPRVDELDPATGKLLQSIADAPTLAGPTGLAVVSQPPDTAVDVYIQDGDSCAIFKADRVPKFVPPATPTSAVTPTTVAGADKKVDNVTTPTIPTGQTGPQIQPGVESQGTPQPQPQVQPQPQPQVQPGAQVQPVPDAGGAAVNNAASTQSNVSAGANGSGSGQGVAAVNNAAASAQPTLSPGANGSGVEQGVVAETAAPPAPSPALVPAPHGAAGGGQPALAAPESHAPRAAARYAIVRRTVAGPASAVAGMAVMGFFACAVGVAARTDRRAPRAPARSQCRPKRAY